MLEKQTIFDFLEKIFFIYGIIVVIFIVLTYLTGGDAKQISTMFAYGNQGLSLSILVQLFVMDIIIVTTRMLFFTDKIFKKMAIQYRIIGMLGTITAFMVLFILLFDWFPWDQWDAWVIFFLSFGTCVIVSTLIAIIKQNYENKQMSDALEKLKNNKEK